MRQWLATVKYCMRKRDGLHDDIRLIFIFYFYHKLLNVYLKKNYLV
jgi:hypothetical protein